MEDVYGSGGFQILPCHRWQLIILSRNMAGSRSLIWYTRTLLERWITFYHLMMSSLNKMGIRFNNRLEPERLLSALRDDLCQQHSLELSLNIFPIYFSLFCHPTLTLGMINQHTQSSIILNAPHFPTHDKMFFFSRKFCHPQDTSFRHVANSHEQKLTSTCCLSVKMTDKMFFFSSCLRDNTSSPPRHDSAHWELKSWRENLEILTYFWLPMPKIVSITLLLTRPGFVPGPWGFLDIMKTWHEEMRTWWSVNDSVLTSMSRDREIAVSERAPKTKMAKI